MNGRQRTYNTATIDGRRVKTGRDQTILQAATKAGIYIPTLCHLKHLEPYGGCRLCVVEVKGMKGFPTSCTTPIMPGMEILTQTTGLMKLRREILEFTLSEHPFTCLVCKDKKECSDFMHTTRKVNTITGCNFCTSNGDCELQDLVEILELDDMKFPISYRGIPPVKDNPFYDLDYNLCVLCGRCVRICNEERNSHVLAFVQRGNTTIVGTAFGDSQLDAGCEFCGACVDVCPTGSISEKMGKWRGVPDRSVGTTCTICPVACQMNVNTRNGRLVQIGAKPGGRTDPPQLCLRGKFLPQQLNDHPSRITKPLVRKEGKWVEVSWKDALEYTAARLRDYRGSYFGVIGSGQDTLEDNYTLQKFARKVMGSNNVDLHGSYPDREVPALIHRFHAVYPPPGLEDIVTAQSILIIGLDGSLSHPMLENRIRKSFMAGRNVIYAGALPNRTSTFVTLDLHFNPGDEEQFLRSLVNEVAKDPQGLKGDGRPETGIPKSKLEKAASILSEPGRVVIIPSDDLLRTSSAREILDALFRLHGMLDKKGSCNILFPHYEGNVYGAALAGLHPDYLPGFKPVGKEKMAGDQGMEDIRALLLVGDLPLERRPGGLKFLVQCNMFLTSISAYADVFLPVTDFLENEGHILSVDDRLKKVNRVLARPGESRSIAHVISHLAAALDEPGFSHKPVELFRELKSAADLPVRTKKESKSVRNKWVIPVNQPVKGRQGDGYPIHLMIRYNHFRYRGNLIPEWVPELVRVSGGGSVGLSDKLMESLKLKEGDPVRIISEHGKMDSAVRILPGLEGQSACLFENGTGTARILAGDMGTSVLNVRIEKI
jgi:formate dehydrogenase alpha subunit